jgi:hypothetical protein
MPLQMTAKERRRRSVVPGAKGGAVDMCVGVSLGKKQMNAADGNWMNGKQR